MKKTTRLILLISFCCMAVLSVSPALAASFDCAKARTKVEKMICADPELSKLDEKLGLTYGEARNNAADPAVLKHKQREWLKERNRCKRATCLADQYRQRLGELTPVPEFKTIYPEDISEFEIDCDTPGSKMKKLICKVDYREYQQMFNALQWAMMRGKDKHLIRESQRQWQAKWFAQCQDPYCMSNHIYERINALETMTARPNECYVPEPTLDSKGYVEPIKPISQALELNLNQFCDQPPMVCELKVAPQFRKEITFPAWSPIDPGVNLGLIERFFRTPFLARSGGSDKLEKKIWQDEKKKINASLTSKNLTFAESKLDFYNLGISQKLYRIDYGSCLTDNICLRNRRDWDKPLKRAPLQIDLAPDVAAFFYKNNFLVGTFFYGNVFFYLGETYSYVMGGTADSYTKADVNELFVLRRDRWANPTDSSQVNNLMITEIAKFRYRSK